MASRLLSCVAAVVAVCAITSAASAHEFWIQPQKFRASVGEVVGARLMVGDGFPGEARPLDPTKLEKFIAWGPGGEQKIAAEPGDEPAGVLKPAAAGVYVLGYRGKNSRVVLDGAKFEKYLTDKGLEAVVKEHVTRQESDREGRELYSRCAKSIVVVGAANSPANTQGSSSGNAGDVAKALGMPLELVPVTDPTAAKAGGEIKFKVLRDGKPAAELLVEAFAAGESKPSVKARTSETGEVSLKLDRAGMWLISSVSMHRAAAGQDAEWESLWASLTFERAAGEAEKANAGAAAPVDAKPVTPATGK